LGNATIAMVDKSLERIAESNVAKREAEEDEDNEDFDDDDVEVFKDEVKAEYELQLNCAEVMGILMKTHPANVNNMIGTLRQQTLTAAFASGEQKRAKFALFVLDDIVEHLGPSYFSETDFKMIVSTICGFVTNPSTSLR